MYKGVENMQRYIAAVASPPFMSPCGGQPQLGARTYVSSPGAFRQLRECPLGRPRLQCHAMAVL